jgi:hypothetical protein
MRWYRSAQQNIVETGMSHMRCVQNQMHCMGEIISKRIILETGCFRTFLGLIPGNSDILFAVVHPLPKGGSRLGFAADLDDPLQVCHEAALGQWEVCQLWTYLSKTEICPQWRHLAIDALDAIKSPGMRRQWNLVLSPSTKTGSNATIWDFSAWKSNEM